LPDKWFHIDEWYNFTKLPEDINVLVTIDENSYKGGNYGEGHPIAWYHEFQSGRSFYTAMGHREENYSDPLFLKHLLGGILYTIGGDNKMIH
jgi:type 1 glutamine amidotransferase